MKIIWMILLFCGVVYGDRDGGPYLGVGYGSAKYDDDNIYKKQVEDKVKLIVLYGGAYINKHLSVEINYVEFNKYDKFIVLDDNDKEKKITFTSIDVGTLVHYAFFDDMLDFYVKFSVGEIKVSEIDASGFTMVQGGGVALRLSKRFALKVAYDRYNIEYIKEHLEKNMQINLLYTALEVQF